MNAPRNPAWDRPFYAKILHRATLLTNIALHCVETGAGQTEGGQPRRAEESLKCLRILKVHA
jgi:hypothetical protein